MTGDGGRSAPLRRFDPADRDERETYAPETYAQLLKRATVSPETLTLTEWHSLTAEDRKLVAATCQFHTDNIDLELARRARAKRTGVVPPPVKLIPDKRWQEILGGFRSGKMRVIDLSIDEIRIIDNNAGLKAEFEAAFDEGW